METVNNGSEHNEIESSSLHVEVLPAERVYGIKNGPKEYTHILDVTNELVEVLNEQGINLADEVTFSDDETEPTGGIFKRKGEFHLTCFDFKHAPKLQAAAEAYPDGVGVFKQKMTELLSETAFDFEINIEGVHLVENLDYDPEAVREGRAFTSEATIIIDVHTTGIAELYQRVNETFGVDLGPSAAHATLYIKQQTDPTTIGLGIAVTDLEAQQKASIETGTHIRVRGIGISDLVKE